MTTLAPLLGTNGCLEHATLNLRQGITAVSLFVSCFRFLCVTVIASAIYEQYLLAADAVNETPLTTIEPVLAFSELNWTGWESDNNGVPTPLRPILLTHAGDGSKRIFVPQQQGIIHVFTADSKQTKVFLDLSKKVQYIDKENEEGFLGMAFHPKYKSNGEFFVFYVTTSEPHTTVVSRFKVSKEDPNKADPNSEEEILRVTHPYWNHKGGTICFGPDGYLYIGLGDGGAGNDPHNNGQNLQTLLGKILRIDVNHKDSNLNYAIPS
ncbi:MAG: PQQ-dependent sugar dehydrogenase, partial [Planctomycetes bacterium]|nr:PQQ-dependent sugar dehydrogenase [Planctomycetota bacterium]